MVNEQPREAREKIERSAGVIGRDLPSQVAERIMIGEYDEDAHRTDGGRDATGDEGTQCRLSRDESPCVRESEMQLEGLCDRVWTRELSGPGVAG